MVCLLLLDRCRPKRLVLLLTFALALAHPAYSQSPPAAQELDTLRARLAQLESELEALKSALGALAQLPPAPTPGPERASAAGTAQQKQAPVLDAGRTGFGWKSADGAFQLRLRGLLQADTRLYLADTPGPWSDTFVMRRVRPIIQATVLDRYDFRITPDFGDGRVVVQDAYIDMRFTPGARLRAGKFKSPFGLERLASASDLLFLERGSPTAVAPNRDVGVMVLGDVFSGTTSYAFGAFNGVPDGGSADLDDQDGKDVVGRLFVHPFQRSRREGLRAIGLGVAGSYGIARGLPALPNLPLYRTTGQQIFFRYRLDGSASGTSVADGARKRFSAQGYSYFGPFGVLVEQTHSSQSVRRGATADDIAVTAWQVAGSWVLTGERASYRGVIPRRDFDPSTGSWGAVELAARYHQLRVAREAFPVFADPAATYQKAGAWTFGVNWHLGPGVKVVLDYERTRLERSTPGANRQTAHDLFSRLQFAF